MPFWDGRHLLWHSQNRCLFQEMGPSYARQYVHSSSFQEMALHLHHEEQLSKVHRESAAAFSSSTPKLSPTAKCMCLNVCLSVHKGKRRAEQCPSSGIRTDFISEVPSQLLSPRLVPSVISLPTPLPESNQLTTIPLCPPGLYLTYKNDYVHQEAILPDWNNLNLGYLKLQSQLNFASLKYQPLNYHLKLLDCNYFERLERRLSS